MARDYELNRISVQIEQLSREQEQLYHAITKTKRDEQFELDRIRRDYAIKIASMESRQQEIMRELLAKRKDYERTEQRTRDEMPSPTTNAHTDKQQRLGRIR
ncbi:MAG: hypothetical protein RL097_546 [Candidatus Parcubacteria bacterium]|jgi:hypothetical protein